MRWWRRALVAVATSATYSVVVTSVAAALLASSSSASLSVSTDRIFPTTQSTAAWDVQDASAGGTAATTTDALAAVDARLLTTAALTTSFSSTRYVELTMSTPLADAVPVSSMALNLTMAQSGGGTACVYVEVRRASTGAVLGTQGSSTTPLACTSSTTQATTTSNLTYITSSTDADDLKLRIFVRNSSSQKIAFDRVTVSGSAYSTAFTLYETSTVNSSSGTAATTPWSLAADDATTYAPASAWTTAFTSARYLKLTFPAIVPTGADLTSVTLRHAYASSTSVSSCVYIEVYAGTTLLGTHGSATSPLSCRTTTTQATDVISLAEVDTVAEVNTLSVRVYVRNAGSSQTRHGLATLTIGYSLT
jgi:hypothetical protein